MKDKTTINMVDYCGQRYVCLQDIILTVSKDYIAVEELPNKYDAVAVRSYLKQLIGRLEKMQ